MGKKNVSDAPLSKKEKRKRVWLHIVFWVCLALIIAPFAYFGNILYKANEAKHAPVIGNRYDGDHDPAITSEQIEQVKTAVAGVSQLESSDALLQTGTLRIYADVTEDVTSDLLAGKADEIYAAVASVLDPGVYFTKTDSEKMYDLEINVYTTLDSTAENFAYLIQTKNSGMEAPASQLVSVPRNAELAQQLRDDVVARKAAEEAEQNAQPAEGTDQPADTGDGSDTTTTEGNGEAQ